MATQKKYVSIEKLGLYDEKIKKVITDGDAAALQSAMDYADGLATNYDAAGSAAGALADAKLYADGKDAAIQAAQTAANNAAAAAATADGKAVTAQGEVDALEAYVGTIPDTSDAATIVAYVQEKTSGIATEGAMTELGNRVTDVEGDVATIKANYLDGEDKTELEGKIGTAQAAAEGAQAYAEGVAGDLAEAVEALEGADEAQVARIAALEGTITGLSGAMHFEGVVESDPTKITAGYEQGDVVIYGNKEYVWNNGAFVEFGDASVNAEAITALTGRVDTLAGDMTQAKTDIEGLEGAVATKVEQSAYDAKVAELAGADTALGNRIATLEGKFGGADGSVEDMIADAKAEAIATAGTNADTKDEAVLAAAKKYADDEDAKIETRVEGLEADTHTHGNKALLDTYTQTEANLADAVAKKHEHSNLTVLEGITAAKVSAWDAAEGNAKSHADAEIAKDRARLDAVEAWQANFVECSEEDIAALFN